MQTRRAQTPITIRSDRAAARLAVLTRGGRSQVQVIEDALDRLPDPVPSPDLIGERVAALLEITAQTSRRVPPIPGIAEFDAREYDERGDPR